VATPITQPPAPTPGAGVGQQQPSPAPPALRAPRWTPDPHVPQPPGSGWIGGIRNTDPPPRATGSRGTPGHDITSRDKGVAGLNGGRSDAVGRSPVTDQPTGSRTTPFRSATNGSGLGPIGPVGTGRDEDRERRRPAFLEADDPNELFGTDQLTAPPVIGDIPPMTEQHHFRR
jgi:hypothetical protein